MAPAIDTIIPIAILGPKISANCSSSVLRNRERTLRPSHEVAVLFQQSCFLHSLWSHPLQCELANGEVLSLSAFIKKVREDFWIAGGQSGANLCCLMILPWEQLAKHWSQFQFPRIYNSNTSFWLTVRDIVHAVLQECSIKQADSYGIGRKYKKHVP
jgi:hypothetical protein